MKSIWKTSFEVLVGGFLVVIVLNLAPNLLTQRELEIEAIMLLGIRLSWVAPIIWFATATILIIRSSANQALPHTLWLTALLYIGLYVIGYAISSWIPAFAVEHNFLSLESYKISTDAFRILWNWLCFLAILFLSRRYLN